MKGKPELSTILYTCISILFLLIFIPVLFCVLFFGNAMDYYENVKLITLFGNKRIAIFSILVILGFFLLFAWLKKVKLSGKMSMLTNLGLGAAFVLLYFANVEVCKCIWFRQGWDVECVVGSAYNLLAGTPIGSEVYYSIYPNNVPMAFILYVIYGLAHRLPFYSYTPDFLWLQVICALVSVTGFVTCITIKKLTESLAATTTGLLLYVACVGMSPWKTVPYTDMFALLFPILCLCFYVFFYTAETKGKKLLYLFLTYFVGIMGSLIKPTVLVVVIAITVLELVHGIKSLKTEWKELLFKIAMLVVVALLYKGVQSFIYDVTGYTPNEEISATYHHYLLMGLNEETTGGYYMGDFAFFGSFDTKEERIPAQTALTIERLKEKGAIGYPCFLLKKMVMTFNDGAFGWGREGNITLNSYPVLSDASYVDTLKNFFWPNHKNSGYFNTYCQIVWFAILFSLPGFCFCRKEKKRETHLFSTILLSMLGVILYLMLFEARARYMICFLPVFILAGTVGIAKYYSLLETGIGRFISFIKQKKKG